MSDHYIQPDLVVYLADVDTLLERIERRNVPMEGRIPPSYLKDLIQFTNTSSSNTSGLACRSCWNRRIRFHRDRRHKLMTSPGFPRFKNVTGLYYAPPVRGGDP